MVVLGGWRFFMSEVSVNLCLTNPTHDVRTSLTSLCLTNPTRVRALLPYLRNVRSLLSYLCLPLCALLPYRGTSFIRIRPPP